MVHSIDGVPVPVPSYLIPNRTQSYVLLLKNAVSSCRRLPADCDAVVQETLYPVVKRLTSGKRVKRLVGRRDVEFSIVEAQINLRGVQRKIGRLAAGEAKRSDFYEPVATLGRWRTRRGRIQLVGMEPAADLLEGPAVKALLKTDSDIDFDLYRKEGTLIYVKDSCSPSDTKTPFFLHLYPMQPKPARRSPAIRA